MISFSVNLSLQGGERQVLNGVTRLIINALPLNADVRCHNDRDDDGLQAGDIIIESTLNNTSEYYAIYKDADHPGSLIIEGVGDRPDASDGIRDSEKRGVKIFSALSHLSHGLIDPTLSYANSHANSQIDSQERYNKNNKSDKSNSGGNSASLTGISEPDNTVIIYVSDEIPIDLTVSHPVTCKIGAISAPLEIRVSGAGVVLSDQAVCNEHLVVDITDSGRVDLPGYDVITGDISLTGTGVCTLKSCKEHLLMLRDGAQFQTDETTYIIGQEVGGVTSSYNRKKKHVQKIHAGGGDDGVPVISEKYRRGAQILRHEIDPLREQNKTGGIKKLEQKIQSAQTIKKWADRATVISTAGSLVGGGVAAQGGMITVSSGGALVSGALMAPVFIALLAGIIARKKKRDLVRKFEAMVQRVTHFSHKAYQQLPVAHQRIVDAVQEKLAHSAEYQEYKKQRELLGSVEEYVDALEAGEQEQSRQIYKTIIFPN